MERWTLRILVLVLLATTIGFWQLAHSKVITGLPPQPPRQPEPITNPGPSGQTGNTQPPPTGATGSTGQPIEVQPPPTGQTGATGTGVPKAKNPMDDYMISIEEAKAKWDKAQAGENIVFVDAREFVEYKEGHIARAMSCPKRRFDGAAPAYVRNNLPGMEVVVYCHGELCTDSEAVIIRLQALKLNIGPFYIIRDGYPAWVKAGYPINTGDSEGWN